MVDENYTKRFLADCLKANKELSLYIKNNLKEDDFKGTGVIGFGGDEINQIDQIAEDIFVKHLIKYASIQSEESGLIASTSENTHNKLIILDPIDGTDNLINSLPYYGTSIAFNVLNKTKISFIYNLVNDKYFFKTPYENNISINNNNNNNTKFAIFERAYSRCDIVKDLYNLNIKYRSPGAVALSLANAVNYKYFLLAGKLRKEDICAGLHICEDLNIFQNHNFLLISKNIDTFNSIKDIINHI